MSAWDNFWVCPCGNTMRAPFGDVFHIHVSVCPRCGGSKYAGEVVTGRWVRTGWFKPDRFERLEETPKLGGGASSVGVGCQRPIARTLLEETP